MLTFGVLLYNALRNNNFSNTIFFSYQAWILEYLDPNKILVTPFSRSFKFDALS
jgi:hypothetical protein